MEGLEITCFQIISNVGTARSSYFEAIHKAKGHEAHFELLQREAKGGPAGSSLILIHAEDQLMSAEGFKIIAEEMIASYEQMDALEKKLMRQSGT